MGKKVREFMTHREPSEHIWMERDEAAVIGTARMGQRLVPKIRAFDLLRSTPLTGNRARATVFEGESLRVTTEYIAGRETQLTRACDYDTIYLQFCGKSKIESEGGVIELEPGEIALLPSAISHRTTGTDQCLRVRVATLEAVVEGVDPQKPTMQRKFTNRPSEPIAAANGSSAANGTEGPVLEHMSFWDPISDLWVERDVNALIGCKREGGREVRKLEAFNYFTGMTGQGGARAPILYNAQQFRVDVYNLEQEQNGFHRGCDEDEIWIQFRGHSLNHTEWGAMELDAGQMSYIPRGVAHRITGSPGFLRMVLYSRKLVHPKTFNNVSERETRFDVQ